MANRMKILAVRTHYKSADGTERLSATDWWRVQNPLTHIANNTEHTVDFVNKVVDEHGDAEMQWEQIGNEYDVIYTSYIDSPKGYAYIKAVSERFGIKHVMDLDDNIFDIDPYNPAYLRYGPDSQHLQNAKIILANVDHLVCSTPHLAMTCGNYRQGPISVVENYIDPEFFNRDNINPDAVSKGIHIGYMGSSTHYTDLLQTGALWALRRLVSEYDDITIHLVGSMYDEVGKMFAGYEDKLKQVGGSRDFTTYAREIWANFPFDIGIAPLVDSPFNKSKSSIKYYEYALRDIVGVYSYVEPYLTKVIEGETGLFAENEDEWYEKLKWLIDGKRDKNKLAVQAREHVLANYTIQNHWHKTLEVLESL